ncbi:MAG TPA: methyltransferase domain-containing protein [Terriglobales bacterium]|nr:methyltransferase domain-containing protein [Terriglobales bacterium]
MGVIGGRLGYHILRAISPKQPAGMDGGAYAGHSKLEALLGRGVWDEVRDKRVIDFGCGQGSEAIDLAQHGARHVQGIDILERWLTLAREQAARADCQNVSFSKSSVERADIIVSVDAFEHFGDPAGVLESMAGMLHPQGCVLVSFGPTWYHPLGGHLFSVFPWAHLIFTEQALCRWRTHIRNDGARKFSEVEGGLNQMTIARFERLVEQSRFRIERLEAVPIRPARLLHNRLTREWLTAIVRCKLSLRPTAQRLAA